ncbi:hypothetical protein [Streptomyces sp. Amel2xC10]|uniref:hypothetical protein n=1 Tax=Streptomyces sp. Amel2xC10 TaxID=1305826 RepID=UPI000A14CEA7|nr:hypothetical protein [Streptomyces sp. Amel2xC10]
MNDPFTGPRARAVRPGEHPAWDEALALVNRDLAALLPGRGPLRLLALPSDADAEWEPAERVYVALPDGRRHGDHLDHASRTDPADALASVADAAQDTVLGCLWQVWPVCAEHRLGMHPGRDDDDRVMWECAGGRTPQDPAHVRAIGGLG